MILLILLTSPPCVTVRLNFIRNSNASRNNDPAPGGLFNTTGVVDDRRTADKDQKKCFNIKVVKRDGKGDCWNCGTVPAKMDGVKIGKIDFTFSDDDYDKYYGDGVIITCFENHLAEHLENCGDIVIPDAETDNES